MGDMTDLGYRLGAAAFLLSGFLLASMLGSRGLKKLGARQSWHPSLLNLLRQSLRVGLLLLGVICALGTLGVDVSALVAGFGLTGFALGFALKDVLGNLVAGVLILMFRPFGVGDRLQVAGKSGTVAQIDLRYTVLDAEDQSVLVPNQTCLSQVVVLARGAADERARG